MAPLAMIGYAGYEAACIFRDGCFGPDSPIGLRPPGLTTTMLPIGIVAAIVTGVVAIVLHRQQSTRSPAVLVLIGLATLKIR